MRASGLLIFALGCSSAPSSPALEPCPAGLERVADECAPQKDACEPWSAPALDGTCVPAGVPEGACGEGFASDGKHGCRVVLPSAPCAKGTMAVPGETTCHEVSPCGDAKYPVVADEARTLFVDRAASDGGDGTRIRPFNTLSAAIAAAPRDGTVAVTDGVYEEDLTLRTPVTLVGRCPGRVEIRGRGAAFVVRIEDSVTVRGLAITGSSTALGVFGKNVVLDHLWLHDNLEGGLWAEDGDLRSSFSLTDSLLEDNTELGIKDFAAPATLERIVVRNTKGTKEASGAGVLSFGNDTPSPHAGSLVLRRSLVHGNQMSGVTVIGGTATLEGVWISGTSPSPRQPGYANALSVSRDYDWNLDASAEVSGSILEGTESMGLALDHATMNADRLTIRDLKPTKTGSYGVFMTDDAVLTLTSSVVRRATLTGVAALGSTVHLDRTIIDDTRTDGALTIGGMGLEVAWSAHDVPTSTMKHSIISTAHAFGAYLFGGRLAVTDSAIRNLLPDAEGEYGDGITVMTQIDGEALHRGALEARGLWVSQAKRAAVTVFGADAVFERTRHQCNGFDIITVGQAVQPDGAVADVPYTLDDRGGNVCGCAALAACVATPAEFRPIAN